MFVQISEFGTEAWTYEAKAFSGDKEIYANTLTTSHWSIPLADLGREGWELVGITSESALMATWAKGWDAPTSRPVKTNFFFKRPMRA